MTYIFFHGSLSFYLRSLFHDCCTHLLQLIAYAVAKPFIACMHVVNLGGSLCPNRVPRNVHDVFLLLHTRIKGLFSLVDMHQVDTPFVPLLLIHCLLQSIDPVTMRSWWVKKRADDTRSHIREPIDSSWPQTLRTYHVECSCTACFCFRMTVSIVHFISILALVCLLLSMLQLKANRYAVV